MTLLRGLAALRPGPMTSTTASTKTALRAPALMAAPGISTGTVAEMLVVLGDNPSAFAPRRPSPSSAASAQFRRQAARRSAIA
jgi:hypothetical protein